ncbi:MAG: hypothetical protein HQK50_17465 [Oligoflexia bacterium]|nr:hypothetical protein [Oligoflexia bacterium]MBF0367368.1 hypothetical protein [Oligoflexia bacterium]
MSVCAEKIGRPRSEETPSKVLCCRSINISNPSGDKRTFQILNDELISIIANLHVQLEGGRVELLKKRERRQRDFDQNRPLPTLPKEQLPWKNQEEWRVSMPLQLLHQLKSRALEVVLPANNTEVIVKTLNEMQMHANYANLIFDYEEGVRPLWNNILNGLQNIRGYLIGDLPNLMIPSRQEQRPAAMIRVRALDRKEATLQIDGNKVSAAIFDLALHLYYLLPILKDSRSLPLFYIPKCDHPCEAQWWAQLFTLLEKEFALDAGTIKVTIQIDTFTSITLAEEILYRLKNHATALFIHPLSTLANYLKSFRNQPARALSNLSGIEKQEEWQNNILAHLKQICQRRGAHLIVGHNNFLLQHRLVGPEKILIERIIEEEFLRIKKSEVTGIALYHPRLLPLASNYFHPHPELEEECSKRNFVPEDFFPHSSASRTMHEIRPLLKQSIRFLYHWFKGEGHAYGEFGQDNLTTLEILRWYIWHWPYHRIALDDWGVITKGVIKKSFEEEFENLLQEERGHAPISSIEFSLWTKAKNKAKELFLEELLLEINLVLESGKL